MHLLYNCGYLLYFLFVLFLQYSNFMSAFQQFLQKTKKKQSRVSYSSGWFQLSISKFTIHNLLRFLQWIYRLKKIIRNHFQIDLKRICTNSLKSNLTFFFRICSTHSLVNRVGSHLHGCLPR